MSELARDIREMIAADGPMSVHDVMSLALPHYYMSRDPLGQDFTTAPEISQMFGELIGLWLAQVWLDQGKPSPFALVELGPGRGTLMADALRATKALPGFHEAMTLYLVETSPALRAKQAERLDAIWLSDIKDLPPEPLFLIANEFFDALPIRQFQKTDVLWRERMVSLKGDALEFSQAKPAQSDVLGQLFPDAPDGAVVEQAEIGAKLSHDLQARIAKQGGAGLFIDYGDWRGTGDTLQSLKDNKMLPPLAALGEADLTAHVQFAQLTHPEGVCATPFTTQGAFLERLGITPRATTLANALKGDELEAHIAAHRRLVHPDEMGALFKVMGVAGKGAPELPGFDV